MTVITNNKIEIKITSRQHDAMTSALMMPFVDGLNSDGSVAIWADWTEDQKVYAAHRAWLEQATLDSQREYFLSSRWGYTSGERRGNCYYLTFTDVEAGLIQERLDAYKTALDDDKSEVNKSTRMVTARLIKDVANTIEREAACRVRNAELVIERRAQKIINLQRQINYTRVRSYDFTWHVDSSNNQIEVDVFDSTDMTDEQIAEEKNERYHSNVWSHKMRITPIVIEQGENKLPEFGFWVSHHSSFRTLNDPIHNTVGEAFAYAIGAKANEQTVAWERQLADNIASATAELATLTA